MKLVNVNNVEGLFEVLDKCQGDVYLVSKEGDRSSSWQSRRI